MSSDFTDLLQRLAAVRRRTEELVAPLSGEDCQVQAVEEVSPPKWHLAHTTWFFETFVLGPHVPGFEPFDPRYSELFNSYYVTVGPRHVRAQRGLLTRPTLDEVVEYRHVVDEQIAALAAAPPRVADVVMPLLELGLNHEQQHQELLLTDVKLNLSFNPLLPAYDPTLPASPAGEGTAARWRTFDGGRFTLGHSGSSFAYDNEGPAHDVILPPFALKDRPVTCGEYLEFIDDGGYDEARWWLSDGFAAARRLGWRSPLYWQRDGEGGWSEFTLGGPRSLELSAPVVHLSHFEADAYAHWAGHRLPTESEWEVAAIESRREPDDGHLADDGRLHPVASPPEEGLRQLFGDVWEWTSSAYLPFPGYRAAPGAVGEYNGKFMSGQMVLKGGSVATPRGHLRATYRNFFPPDARWQFAGVRLANDLTQESAP